MKGQPYTNQGEYRGKHFGVFCGSTGYYMAPVSGDKHLELKGRGWTEHLRRQLNKEARQWNDWVEQNQNQNNEATTAAQQALPPVLSD